MIFSEKSANIRRNTGRSRIGPNRSTIGLKTARDEFAEVLEGCVGIVSLGGDADDGSLGGRQHHQSHDAFPVDFFVILFHPDIAGKSTRQFDELCRRAGVESIFVWYRKFADGH